MVEIFGFIGGALGVGAGLPQIYKILKLKHAEGLNRIAWILIFTGTISWMSYGVRIDSISAIISNMVGAVIHGFILFKVLSHQVRFFISLYALFISYCIFNLPEIIVTVLLISFTFAQLPQIINSVDNYRNGRDSAVSLGFLFAILASTTSWATYGFLSDLPTIWITSMIGFTLSFLVLILEASPLRGHLPIKSFEREQNY
jgi:MtN3 and saliva related transmembrane protein